MAADKGLHNNDVGGLKEEVLQLSALHTESNVSNYSGYKVSAEGTDDASQAYSHVSDCYACVGPCHSLAPRKIV